MQTLTVTVLGTAQPQGSKTVYNGRAVDANAAKLKPWRKAITKQTLEQIQDWKLTADPIAIWVNIYLPRPRTVTREHHTVKPDLDKLVRALLDGITDTKAVWVDDSQVTAIRARKYYAYEYQQPQVVIEIESIL